MYGRYVEWGWIFARIKTFSRVSHVRLCVCKRDMSTNHSSASDGICDNSHQPHSYLRLFNHLLAFWYVFYSIETCRKQCEWSNEWMYLKMCLFNGIDIYSILFELMHKISFNRIDLKKLSNKNQKLNELGIRLN